MESIELEVVRWIAAAFSEHRASIERQAAGAEAVAREFTNGGGVFVSIEVAHRDDLLPEAPLRSWSSFEGPVVESPELQDGASTTLVVNDAGLISSLEFWAHAGDYPIGRHPNSFRLTVPQSKVIDLR